MKSVALSDIVKFVSQTLDSYSYTDFNGALNGLQFENSGRVSKLAVAVDAGLYEFEKAREIGADLLLVHHGLYWDSPIPITDTNYKKIKTLIEGNIAVLSMHLPLDADSKLGNNAQIAKALNLKKLGTCFEYKGKDIGVIAQAPSGSRKELEKRLKKLFPDTFKSIAFGKSKIEKLAICSGSCSDVVSELVSIGIDTLICGELREHSYTLARDTGLNLYPCGHYATETFGVKALAEKISKKFKLEWEFINTQNPL